MSQLNRKAITSQLNDVKHVVSAFNVVWLPIPLHSWNQSQWAGLQSGSYKVQVSLNFVLVRRMWPPVYRCYLNGKNQSTSLTYNSPFQLYSRPNYLVLILKYKTFFFTIDRIRREVKNVYLKVTLRWRKAIL